MTAPRVLPNPELVARQNQLFDLYNSWPGDGDPDDDPEFVAQARDLMGLPTLDDEPTLDQIRAMAEQDDAVRAAAGHDVTPGHDELHHYWTRGEGLAKWAESPTPWTTLYHHLLKYMNPEMAKRAASKWFIEVFHFASGSDLNRVTHGKPPRGHRVGPG